MGNKGKMGNKGNRDNMGSNMSNRDNISNKGNKGKVLQLRLRNSLKCVGETNYKTCFKHQAGINNFNNCVVLAIQLIVLVCFYYRTTTVLGCVVHNRAMFYKNA